MAEATPTLRMTALTLVNEVAFRIYGTRAPSTEQKAHALVLVNSGYRDFLSECDWDFLHPPATLSVLANATETDLPAVFGDLEGGFAVAPGLAAEMVRIPLEGIYRLRAQLSATAVYPTHFAIGSKSTALTGQIWQAHWYPTPTGALTLYYQFAVEPTALTADDAAIPLGGARDCAAILAAAMKWAESDKNSQPGWWSREYDRRLLACLKRTDRRQVRSLAIDTPGSTDGGGDRQDDGHDGVGNEGPGTREPGPGRQT